MPQLTRYTRKKSRSRKGSRSRRLDNQSASLNENRLKIPYLPTDKRAISRITMWEGAPQSFSTSASAATNLNISFQIANLADSSLFSKFEGYKIVAVDVVYKPNSFIGSVPGTATTGSCVAVAFDPDDNTSISLTDLLSKDTCKLFSMYEAWTLTINPRPTPAVYAGGVWAGYSLPDTDLWIDSDQLSIPHYGLKMASPLSYVAASGTIWIRYHCDVVMNE